MAAYKLTATGTVIRTADNAFIPDDPRNSDRAEYQRWLDAGNTPDPADTPTLDQVKAELKAAIDAAAERERMRYITAGAGQALVYEQKRTEVARHRNDPALALTEANFPWAASRAENFEITVAAVLAEWTAQADAWSAIARAIENVREGAKAAIGAAADEAAARAIAEEVSWPEM